MEDTKIKVDYTTISLGAHTITTEDVRSRNLEHRLHHFVALHLQPCKGIFREAFCQLVSTERSPSVNDSFQRAIHISVAP